MGLPAENIISLNKSRLRAVYWRQDSHGNWIQTSPLPADPASINYYFLKGFKALCPHEGIIPSNGENPSEIKTRFLVKCPFCEFETQSAFGLQAHLRKHITKSKKKEEET